MSEPLSMSEIARKIESLHLRYDELAMSKVAEASPDGFQAAVSSGLAAVEILKLRFKNRRGSEKLKFLIAVRKTVSLALTCGRCRRRQKATDHRLA